MHTLGFNNEIILLSLPPKTTHMLQPLDVGVFGPFQNAWVKHCEDSAIARDPVTRYNLVEHYMQIRNKYITPQVIQAAFRHSGLWPINRNVFTDEDFVPSQNFAINADMPPTFPNIAVSIPDAMQDMPDQISPTGMVTNASEAPISGTLSSPLAKQTRSKVRRAVGITPSNSGTSKPRVTAAHLLCLEEEQARLKQQLYVTEGKLEGMEVSLQEAVAHCSLAHAENQNLHQQLEIKGKRKNKRKINTLACVLTPLEGKIEWEEKRKLQLEKEREEQQKVQTKADALQKREHKQIKTMDTRFFELPLSCYTRRDDLKDIAACFSLAVPDKAKNPELLAKIKQHMASNPILLKLAEIVAVEDGEEPEEEETSETLESEDEIPNEEDEDKSPNHNIDPSLL
ncbi:hypothetical protein M422DRAFT_262946 [Sphaerobolus stellatus SS14]|uniref:DDE-1 domain-containing protein n=1 Tax=Sphaerobolus stellatus (strain SS14) TaxID=990650 RepID=A0A0C9VBW1_SPHS4|nr:hypothetical protein M422DRAFT_262946 [Sphaerobolus stellatus SS14]